MFRLGHQLNDRSHRGPLLVAEERRAVHGAVHRAIRRLDAGRPDGLDHAVSLPRYARLPSAGLVDTLPAKQIVTLAGYGAQGVLHPRDPIFIGTRLTASGIISTRNYVIRDTILAVTLQGRANLCFGDSGSPVLVGDTILGVFSFLNGQCSTAGFAYRIDQPDVLAALASIH